MEYLNLGCGGNILKSWENHDADIDITKPLPFPDNKFFMILMEHVLEHISGPDVFRCLKECHRVLVPGGFLRVCVPILDRLTPEAAIDIVVNHGHKVILDFNILRRLLCLADFQHVVETERRECDGHWKVIGEEKDTLETLRLEASK